MRRARDCLRSIHRVFGRQAATMHDDYIKDLRFVGIVPSGHAIPQRGADYHFVNLGQKVARDPVVRAISDGQSTAMFAAQ
jgi:hypothetical protein